MIQFEPSFFEEEVRDGFTITPMMKRAWAAQMEVLMDVDRICRAHGIKYFVNWGTLLGAVRHKGFIPWDDDIDIVMLRDDYQKFCRLKEQLAVQGYEIVNVNNDAEYDNMIARVVNGRYVDIGDVRLSKFHNCPYVVGVDIDILDCKAKDPDEDQIQLEMVGIVLQSVSAVSQYENGECTFEELKAFLEQVAGLCGVSFNYEKPLKQQLRVLGEQLCMLYRLDEVDEVQGLVYRVSHRPNYFMPKEWFSEIIYMPFEGVIEVPVPVGYDGLLQLAYGDDYMTPRSTWQAHGYPFYKDQEKVLAKFLKDNGVSGDAFFIDMSKYGY